MSKHTGITQYNQSIEVAVDISDEHWLDTFLQTGLNDISKKSTSFVVDRQWEQHDTNMNLALALCAEAGELADVIAWTGNSVKEEKIERIRDRIAQELADIIILTVRFAKNHNINLYHRVENYHQTKRNY